MQEIISSLKDTPVPTILVVSGVLFLLLSIVDQIAGQLTVNPALRRRAGLIGGLLVTLGVTLYVIPISRLDPLISKPTKSESVSIQGPTTASESAPTAETPVVQEREKTTEAKTESVGSTAKPTAFTTSSETLLSERTAQSKENTPSLKTNTSEPLTKSGKATPQEIPDWVPIYPFSDELENILLRQESGSFSFATENDAQHVRSTYAAKLRAAGWKVKAGYDGGYYVGGNSPDQRRFIAAIASSIASSKEGKTRVVVIFFDHSLVSSGESSPLKGIPNWVPIYPGKVGTIRSKGNSGGFSIITSHSTQQVTVLYAALLRTSGYEVATGYDGAYYVRGTAESQGRSIIATANANDRVTKVLVMFEGEK